MKQEINAVLDEYIDAWNQMQFDRLRALWDEGESEIYYLAEEIEHAFYQFSEILEYWQHTGAILEWLKISVTNRRIKPLTDALCTLSYDMQVDASMTGSSAMGFKPVGVDVRVSAILKKGPNGWRFIHYTESTLGALPFVRKMYNANVRSNNS